MNSFSKVNRERASRYNIVIKCFPSFLASLLSFCALSISVSMSKNVIYTVVLHELVQGEIEYPVYGKFAKVVGGTAHVMALDNKRLVWLIAEDKLRSLKVSKIEVDSFKDGCILRQTVLCETGGQVRYGQVTAVALGPTLP